MRYSSIAKEACQRRRRNQPKQMQLFQRLLVRNILTSMSSLERSDHGHPHVAPCGRRHAIVVLLSVVLVPAASAGGVAAPAASAGCFYYIVRPGDNLTRLRRSLRDDRVGHTAAKRHQEPGPDLRRATPADLPVGTEATAATTTAASSHPCPPVPCYQPCAPAASPTLPWPIPIPPQPKPGPWTAQYFNNTDLSGSPAVNGSEASQLRLGYGRPRRGKPHRL